MASTVWSSMKASANWITCCLLRYVTSAGASGNRGVDGRLHGLDSTYTHHNLSTGMSIVGI